MRYDFQAIEKRWQTYWDQHRTFRTANPGEPGFDASRPKFYVLDMFPYPSGVGLHVGHPLGYIATDIIARFKRMRGFNVLHPMGFDAFGLPAEQFAVEHGVHPRATTEQNIDNMVRQLRRLGLGYDWDRQLATTDVGYYKWTQWIFLQLYNSWFDESVNAARPIEELEEQLVGEKLYVGIGGQLVPAGVTGELQAVGGDPIGVRKWRELSTEERSQIIDDQRLAYLAEVPVNWCPALGTVLANEEVTNDGRSERGNYPVFRRPLKQWMLRITAYADRLIDDLELVAWPEAIKLMQRNWIGKSNGARVNFALDGDEGTIITVFTTRPDTLFGATYMVLAPEHPLVEMITTEEQTHAVADYVRKAAGKADVDRQADTKEKTGAFTGAYAVNPVNGESIPVWIADYVMMGYGTGAIMAVPAHDDRDFAFAKAFSLPIRAVVEPTESWLKSHNIVRDAYVADAGAAPEAFTGEGVAVNSANNSININGKDTAAAKLEITLWLEDAGIGKGEVQYKLRDWLFSRQRYWGEPFPILHGPDGEIRGVDEADLPVELPPMEDFRPSASDDPNAPVQTPLSRAPESWRLVTIDGVTYERELNTMPQWAGSCWYYLRFLDPTNSQRFVSREAENYWMVSEKKSGGTHAGGIDLYVGGAEHAVLHLLYSRFWHKVLFDLGEVSTPEPFGKLFNQGYIQGYFYEKANGMRVEATKVVNKDGKAASEVQGEKGQQFFYEGEAVFEKYGKMGKSLKNAVSPDEICEQYGCDSLRLYEMYLGPLDQSKPWRTDDIVGVHRFLLRMWRNFIDEKGGLKVTDDAPAEPLRRQLHKTIKRVTEEMETMRYNTAIAAIIELNNAVVALDKLPREVAETMVLLLNPLAPHMAEELWAKLGHEPSVADQSWPVADEAMLVENTVEMPIQINGKVKGKIVVPIDADDAAVEAAARADAKVAATLEGKTIRKVIVVPNRMVNIVAN